MPKIRQLLGMKNRDESQGRNETDADYLARIVRENAQRQNFSALTFRFSYQLGLSLRTAELARTIAGYDYPMTTLDRYSELDLPAASVYMASPIDDKPKSSTDVALLTGVDSRTIEVVCNELRRAHERIPTVEWYNIFGEWRNVTAV